MSAVNGSTIDQAVHEAYVAEGYINEDGSRDAAKMRERILELVVQHKALDKRDRADVALLRGDLIAGVFPSMIGPDRFADEPNPDHRSLLEAVYNKVAGYVWAAVTPHAAGPIQRMVGLNMGNGYVLCRTKVGKDRIDAVYVTDDLECIRLDFTRPDNQALERKIEGSTRNREMLILRQPQHAKAYASEYDKTLKNALTTAHNQLALTMEAVSNKGPEPDDDDDSSEDED